MGIKWISRQNLQKSRTNSSSKFHMLILKHQVQLSGFCEIAQRNETRVALT